MYTIYYVLYIQSQTTDDNDTHAHIHIHLYITAYRVLRKEKRRSPKPESEGGMKTGRATFLRHRKRARQRARRESCKGNQRMCVCCCMCVNMCVPLYSLYVMTVCWHVHEGKRVKKGFIFGHSCHQSHKALHMQENTTSTPSTDKTTAKYSATFAHPQKYTYTHTHCWGPHHLTLHFVLVRRRRSIASG